MQEYKNIVSEHKGLVRTTFEFCISTRSINNMNDPQSVFSLKSNELQQFFKSIMQNMGTLRQILENSIVSQTPNTKDVAWDVGVFIKSMKKTENKSCTCIVLRIMISDPVYDTKRLWNSIASAIHNTKIPWGSKYVFYLRLVELYVFAIDARGLHWESHVVSPTLKNSCDDNITNRKLHEVIKYRNRYCGSNGGFVLHSLQNRSCTK